MSTEMASYDPPDWVERNQGAAKSAFERAAKLQGNESAREMAPPTPKPSVKLEMKGPLGEEVRRQVSQQNAAVLRAQKIASQQRQAGLEKDTTSKALGAQYEAKKAIAQEALDLKPAAEKAAQSRDQSARAIDEEQRRNAVDRALKLADKFNGVAKSNEHEK